MRVNHSPHENRATNTPVTVDGPTGRQTMNINQQEPAPLDKGFISLGTFRFESGKPVVVIIGYGPSNGHVHADAVQLFPVK